MFHPAPVEAVLYGEVGDEHTSHEMRPDRRAHGLVACMPIPAELTEPQGLASAFLPAKLRAPLVEPLVLGAACPDPRFDLQVVIPYFCEAANYRAIPSIQRVERFMRHLGLPYDQTDVERRGKPYMLLRGGDHERFTNGGAY